MKKCTNAGCDNLIAKTAPNVCGICQQKGAWVSMGEAPGNMKWVADTGATTTLKVEAVSPKARELLVASLKWIRRIEERADEIQPLFLDNIDVKPLRKSIEDFLNDWDKKGELIPTPAGCKQCGARYVSPTTGLVWDECQCGGKLMTEPND